MTTFIVHVRYRTNSGCNTTDVRVDAPTMSEALHIASEKVRRRRGVIRIDGGDCREVAPRAKSLRQMLIDRYD
jgi:translation initiation factor 1 (eIF-1/SUI1)